MTVYPRPGRSVTVKPLRFVHSTTVKYSRLGWALRLRGLFLSLVVLPRTPQHDREALTTCLQHGCETHNAHDLTAA